MGRKFKRKAHQVMAFRNMSGLGYFCDGLSNTLIAGHAKSLGLIVVTNNTKEFSGIDGLEIENWT